MKKEEAPQPKSWAEVVELLKNERNEVSLKTLGQLHHSTLCRICYDPETPEQVVFELKNHVDASVRAAARQRPAVLARELSNPYIVLGSE